MKSGIDPSNNQEINEWLKGIQPYLNTYEIIPLLNILDSFIRLNIFDLKFLDQIYSSIEEHRQFNELNYLDLTNILFSLYTLKYDAKPSFIDKIISNLSSLEPDNASFLPKVIFSLANIKYYDEKFSKILLDETFKHLDQFDLKELNFLIASYAKLKLFDQDSECNFLYNILNIFSEKYNTQTVNDINLKLNNAFYLTMIFKNHLSEKLNQALEPRKAEIINKIYELSKLELQGIKLENLTNIKDIQKLVQIHLTDLCQINDEIIRDYVDKLRENSLISSSRLQNQVKVALHKKYPHIQLYSEHFNTKRIAFLDLLIEKNSGESTHDHYLEIDGPDHFFINHQPTDKSGGIITASTLFRNKLHEASGIKFSCISYIDVKFNRYKEQLFESATSFPEEYWQEQEKKTNIENTVKEQSKVTKSKKSENNPGKQLDKVTEPNKNKDKKLVPKSKNKPGKKQDQGKDDDWDAALEEAQLANQKVANDPNTKLKMQYNEVLKYVNKDKKQKQVNELKFSINEKNINNVEIIINYYKNNNQESKYNTAFEYAISKIFDDRASTKEYLEIAHFILINSGDITSYTSKYLIMALIYSFNQNDAVLFESFLSFLPENQNSFQLMEYFFINCGSTNNIEIADLLLSKGININIYYSRESLEVIYAVATGFYHNNKPIRSELLNALTENLYQAIYIQSTDKLVENIIQNSAAGTQDGLSSGGRGLTALHISCYGEERYEIRSFLLSKGANPNTISSDDFNPLITSIFHNKINAALQILDSGPNVNLKMTGGLLALHIASYLGFRDVVKKIISQNPDLDIPISKELAFTTTTAFDPSSSSYKEIQMQFFKNDSPLMIAIRQGHFEIVQDLIAAGADVNINSIPNPIMFCCIHKPEYVDILLRNGANPNANNIDSAGNLIPSVLMIAAEHSNFYTFKRTYKEGDFLTTEKYIHFNKYHSLEIFARLLLYGADPDFKDIDGDQVDKYIKGGRPGDVIKFNKMINFIRELPEATSLIERKISFLEYLEEQGYFAIVKEYQEELKNEYSNKIALITYDSEESFIDEQNYPPILEDNKIALITNGDEQNHLPSLPSFGFVLEKMYLQERLVNFYVDTKAYYQNPDLEKLAILSQDIEGLARIIFPGQKFYYGANFIKCGYNINQGEYSSGFYHCMNGVVKNALGFKMANFLHLTSISYKILEQVYMLDFGKAAYSAANLAIYSSAPAEIIILINIVNTMQKLALEQHNIFYDEGDDIIEVVGSTENLKTEDAN